MLTLSAACLHIWVEQVIIILMSKKIQIIMSSSVNPVVLRPVLGIVLARDSVLLKMEQLKSWLLSGHPAVSFFPVMTVTESVQTTHAEGFYDSIVLIISCLILSTFVTPGSQGDQLFHRQEAGDMEGPLCLEGLCTILLYSMRYINLTQWISIFR